MDVSEGTENRQETLNRYRHLRAINKSHHSEITKHLPKKSFLTWGKRLGLIKGKKTLVANSIAEVHLLNDIAIYSTNVGNTTPVERYRNKVDFPAESDEAVVLDAMCNFRFTFIMVLRRHPVVGLIVGDLFHQEEIWLMDERFEETVPEGYAFASRLFKPDEFYISSGIAIPVDEGVVEEISAVCPITNFDTATNRHKNIRLIEAVYKTAIKRGLMETISFE